MPLNWRLAQPELAYQLADAEPAVLLLDEEHAESRRALPRPLRGAGRASRLEPLLGSGAGATTTACCSSTPPARPGGRRARCSRTRTASGRTCRSTSRPGSRATTSCSPCCPSSTAAAGTCSRCSPGGRARGWCSSPRSTRRARFALIDEKRVTTMMGVPANYLFMAQDPTFETADLSSLRRAVVGGAPMPEALLDTWRERGVEIVQGYGLTEAAPNVLALPPEDAARKRGFAGKPYPTSTSRCAIPRAGRLIEGPGEGELLVRGPNVFAGYWRNPEATARRSPTAGCTPATSPSATTRATTGSSAGRRTSSSRAARTSIRPRSRTSCTSIRPSPRRRWSASPTSAGARSASRSWCCAERGERGGAARVLPRAARALQGAEAACASSTSCRGTRWARSRRPSCWSRRVTRDVKTGVDGARRASAHAPAPARGGRAGLRRPRLPRRLDRQDHRGGGRRPGHLLPLLREQEGDLRRARARSEQRASGTR